MVARHLTMGKTQKVVVLGSRGVGKTSVLEKLIYDNNGPFSSTLEDVYVANVETDRGTKEKLRFYDTAGIDVNNKTDKYCNNREVPRHLLALADAAIIVYSVEDNHSYQIAETIRKDIEENKEKKDMVILVLGTKADLRESRQVELVQAMNWAAAKKIRLAEVSAMDRHSLYEPFMYLASKLNPPPNKSTLAHITSTIKREKNKDTD